jgi:hypothetical protein
VLFWVVKGHARFMSNVQAGSADGQLAFGRVDYFPKE